MRLEDAEQMQELLLELQERVKVLSGMLLRMIDREIKRNPDRVRLWRELRGEDGNVDRRKEDAAPVSEVQAAAARNQSGLELSPAKISQE